MGIEPTTSGLDLPLLCRLSYEVGQRKSGTIKVVNRGEEKDKGTYECCAALEHYTRGYPEFIERKYKLNLNFKRKRVILGSMA